MTTTEVNVNTCGGEIDASAGFQVRVTFNDSQTPGVFGPCDLSTARAVLVHAAARTNTQSATIEPVA